LLPPPALRQRQPSSRWPPLPRPLPALLPRSSSPSSLYPEARPFMPCGRSKAQRWEDSIPIAACAEKSPPPRPSYHDVLAPRPATVARVLKSQSAARVPTAAPRPALRSELSFCSVSCPRQRVDDDDWTLSRSHPCRAVSKDLRGRCFNCFSTRHRATVCRHRTHCFRCSKPGHHSYVCPCKLTASKPLRRLAWRPLPTDPMAVAAPVGEGEWWDPPWRHPRRRC
jgi:hypothetical protein